MLAHHTYPKDSAEARAVRSAFVVAVALIGLVGTLVSVDVAVQNVSAKDGTGQASNMKAEHVLPKPPASIHEQEMGTWKPAASAVLDFHYKPSTDIALKVVQSNVIPAN